MMCLVIIVLWARQGYAEEPLQPITMQLNWITNAQFAGILVAKERGWYEEAGIDLTVKGWENGIAPDQEVLDGRAQLGSMQGADLIYSRAKGNELKAIFAPFQKSPMCLMIKTDRGIDHPSQLKGKRVAVNTPQATLVTKIVLASQNLQFDDMIHVKMGLDLQPFFDDEVDLYIAYMNNEPLITRALGYDVTCIPAFKYGYDFYSDVYFATDTMIREQPELIRKFIGVTSRGWREAFQDPTATAALIVEKYYPEGSIEQQTKSLEIFRILATLGISEDSIGYMDEEFWAKGINILFKYNQIDHKFPAVDLFTLEFF